MKNGNTTGTAIRRLFVLLCGFEILPKSISTRDLGARLILSEPVCAYLLDTDIGPRICAWLRRRARRRLFPRRI